MGWKKDVFRMFFQDGMAINVISDAVGVSRQSISAFLKQQPGYGMEKQKRQCCQA